MKIGLNLLVVGEFIGPGDHATLKRIKDAGYDGVEFRSFPGGPSTIGRWRRCSTISAWRGPR